MWFSVETEDFLPVIWLVTNIYDVKPGLLAAVLAGQYLYFFIMICSETETGGTCRLWDPPCPDWPHLAWLSPVSGLSCHPRPPWRGLSDSLSWQDSLSWWGETVSGNWRRCRQVARSENSRGRMSACPACWNRQPEFGYWVQSASQAVSQPGRSAEFLETFSDFLSWLNTQWV